MKKWWALILLIGLAWITLSGSCQAASSPTGQVSAQVLPEPSAAAVYRYSAANLNAIQHLANQAVSAAGFTADFPANSVTLLVIPSARPFDQHQFIPLTWH